MVDHVDCCVARGARDFQNVFLRINNNNNNNDNPKTLLLSFQTFQDFSRILFFFLFAFFLMLLADRVGRSLILPLLASPTQPILLH